MATESYATIADSLYECNWYELSPKLQKYLTIMITNAQGPMFYHGFGVAVLNLETFNRVRKKLEYSFVESDRILIFNLKCISLVSLQMIRTVLSYYMMFKTLTSNQLAI